MPSSEFYTRRHDGQQSQVQQQQQRNGYGTASTTGRVLAAAAAAPAAANDDGISSGGEGGTVPPPCRLVFRQQPTVSGRPGQEAAASSASPYGWPESGEAGQKEVDRGHYKSVIY